MQYVCTRLLPFLHRAAAAGSANAHALLGTLEDARGADSSAIAHWTAAARVGHASAADALADDLAEDPAVVARFMTKLQTLDIAAQTLRKLAEQLP